MAKKKEILKLSGINKCFGNVVVAKDISLTVISNQLHALIGPNGAGKTTLIKMISGELKPDQGLIMLLDRNCLLYTSPSPRDKSSSRMPSSA